jgi:hypothetical protein
MELDLYYIKNYDTITDEQVAEFKEKINQILIQQDIHTKKFTVGVLPDYYTDNTFEHSSYELTVSPLDNPSENYEITLNNRGIVYTISKSSPVDLGKIREINILKKFPCLLDDCVLQYNEKNGFCCGDERVTAIDIDDDEVERFFDYDNSTTEEWCRLPEYDNHGMLAFALNTDEPYEEMFVSFSLYDPITNKLYHSGGDNPANGFGDNVYRGGYAIRRNDEKIEIYLLRDSDQPTTELLYTNNVVVTDVSKPKCGCYHYRLTGRCSQNGLMACDYNNDIGWTDLRAKDQFDYIYKWLESRHTKVP